jgi:iron complex outermembrane receptor protein
MEYNIFRLQDAKLDTLYRLTKTFESILMPRIGITKLLGNNFSLFAQISQGFSPPSVSEVRTGDGDLNTDLEPEKGINIEAGMHLALFEGFNINFSVFDFSLDQTIVSYTDSIKNTVRFKNTGSTSQRGLETQIKWNIINTKNQFINQLSVYSSSTFNNFQFENYIDDDEDYSGNDLTGVPKFYSNSGIHINSSLGLYFYLNYNYTSKMPLNDSNTAHSFVHHLVDSKIGLKENFKNLNFNLSLGVNNLLNKMYSLGYDLNAYGQRYYQTAPGRNFYLSLNIEYLFKKDV